MEKKENKPLKRDKDLQPVSRDHHHTLLLSWKIRQGFRNNIAPERMKVYSDWFFVKYIKPHFELEEKHVFPVLGKKNELVKKALSEHKRLTKLFKEPNDPERSLSLLEEELEKHIRFEERTLFGEIQKKATKKQLKNINEAHSHGDFIENSEDEFWL